MAINSDYVQQMATQLATFDVQAAQTSVARREANYNAQVKAVSSLKSALTTFSSAVSGLKSSSNGASSLVVNSAKFSSEGYASATVGSTASSGSYDFHVEKLATKSQLALSGIQAGQLGSGTLEIAQGGESVSVSLAGIDSLEGLVAAINSATGTDGAQATLVRSGQGASQQVSLVLTSAKTGADQEISLSFSDLDEAAAGIQRTSLSVASDARVWLGGAAMGQGIELTSSSNTFDNVIDGVSLTFNKEHKAGDSALVVDIAQDQKATKEKAQSFVSAYNTLMSSLASLTASGSDGSGRGALAGDSSVSAIKSLVNQTLRGTFAGTNLINFGIRAGSNGTLTIDGTAFDKALAADPQGFESLFTGKGNLIDSLSDSLKVYTGATNGVLTNRVATLNERLKDINQEFDKLQSKYDASYARYLKQYTNLMQIMGSMEQTSGMF
jgi:flagellar hook-associated protein 2